MSDIGLDYAADAEVRRDEKLLDQRVAVIAGRLRTDPLGRAVILAPATFDD